MKRLLLALVLFLVVIHLPATAAGEATPLDRQVLAILEECKNLKPGSTRADLLKLFTTEGGISTPGQRTYVSGKCAYLKVDVVFDLTEKNQKEERPTDRIRSISNIYLGLSITD